MYRWLGELTDGNVKETETEVKAGGVEPSQNDKNPLTLGSRRKRTKFSTSFKASVLAAYTSVGPAQAARKFGVSEARSDGVMWKRSILNSGFYRDFLCSGVERQG